MGVFEISRRNILNVTIKEGRRKCQWIMALFRAKRKGSGENRIGRWLNMEANE